jgi:hypothetical protein
MALRMPMVPTAMALAMVLVVRTPKAPSREPGQARD